MKKIFTILFAITTLFIINAGVASAQYYQNTSAYTNYTNGYGYTDTSYNTYNPYQTTYSHYQNNYQGQYSTGSYQFIQGCSIYNYNRYTGQTTLIGYTCNTNTYQYNTNYQNQYSYPINYQNQYSYPTNYQNQYDATYHYVNGVWIWGNGNTRRNCNRNRNYSYIYSNNNYGNCQQNTITNCYYQNGYQVCY